MRQVTGNNSRPADKNKVSVRIESGGHSFSLDGLPKKAFDEETTVVFSVITHKTLLVPAELFDQSAAANMLAIAGLECTPDEEPVCTSDNGTVTVMAVAKSAVAAISERFGERARFTSPLSAATNAEGRRLDIRTCGRVSYFTLSEEGRLHFAEALKTDDADEILYYVQAVNNRFILDKYLIYIYGDGAAETAKLLRRYFKGVKCE